MFRKIFKKAFLAQNAGIRVHFFEARRQISGWHTRCDQRFSAVPATDREEYLARIQVHCRSPASAWPGDITGILIGRPPPLTDASRPIIHRQSTSSRQGEFNPDKSAASATCEPILFDRLTGDYSGHDIDII